MSPPTSASSATPRARPTIADVAAEAGVSKATVSRYFNHRERLLSPDIAARVEAAIAKLAYVPSPMAQALSHGRSRLIGLVVADITNPYSVAVLRGAEKACQDAGYLVMLFNLGNDRERERAAIDALASYQVDGFILNTRRNVGAEQAFAVVEIARHRGLGHTRLGRHIGDGGAGARRGGGGGCRRAHAGTGLYAAAGCSPASACSRLVVASAAMAWRVSCVAEPMWGSGVTRG